MNIGAEIQASCGKCGETAHTVTAVMKGASATVCCKQCGAAQRYLVAEDPKATTKVVKAAKTRTGTKRTKKAAAPVWTPDATMVKPVMSRPVRPYRLIDRYQLGDRVDHRTFGIGVVDEILGPQKMQVFFPTGHRMMAQGTPAAA